MTTTSVPHPATRLRKRLAAAVGTSVLLTAVAIGAPSLAGANGVAEPGTITLSPTQGPVGTEITVTGSVDAVCSADSVVFVEIGEEYGHVPGADGKTRSTSIGNATAAGGSFTVTGPIPSVIGTDTPATDGVHDINAYCFSPASNNPVLSATASFTIGDGSTTTTVPVTTTAPTAPEPVVTVTSGEVTAGGTLSFEAEGFAPGSEVVVELHSDPIRLGIVQADQAGRIAGDVTVPATVAPGVHTLVLIGQDATGAPLELRAAVTIAAVLNTTPAAPVGAQPSYTG